MIFSLPLPYALVLEFAIVVDLVVGVDGIPSNGFGTTTEGRQAVCMLLANFCLLSPMLFEVKELPADADESDDEAFAAALTAVFEYWIGKKSFGMINP